MGLINSEVVEIVQNITKSLEIDIEETTDIKIKAGLVQAIDIVWDEFEKFCQK